jgi:predicted ATPase
MATLSEALAFVEESGERYYEAELLRLQAEFQLQEGREAEAEASLHSALRVARRQKAKGWEVRAANTLARLWHKQGKGTEARQLLSPLYEWFDEGCGTPDLEEAAALLAPDA